MYIIHACMHVDVHVHLTDLSSFSDLSGLTHLNLNGCKQLNEVICRSIRCELHTVYNVHDTSIRKFSQNPTILKSSAWLLISVFPMPLMTPHF